MSNANITRGSEPLKQIWHCWIMVLPMHGRRQPLDNTGIQLWTKLCSRRVYHEVRRECHIQTTISGSCDRLLFTYPVLLVLHITVKLLQPQGIAQLLSASLHRIIQRTVPLCQLHLLRLYVVSVKVTSSHKLVRSLRSAVNTVLENTIRCNSAIVLHIRWWWFEVNWWVSD